MAQTQFMKDAEKSAGCSIYLIIGGILFCFLINPYFGLFVLCMSIIWFIWYARNSKQKEMEKKEKERKRLELRRKQEEDYMNNIGIVKDNTCLPWHYCMYLGGHPNIDKNIYIFGAKCYVWLDKGSLYLCNYFDKKFNENNKVDQIEKTSILIKDILYYHLYGDIYNETVVEGGDGGGTSIGGAIIGGLVAGEAGAIIGSRKDVNPVTVRNKKVDNRRIVIEFYCNGKLSRMNLGQWDFTYDWFLRNLPEKEMIFVINNKKQIDSSSKDILSQVEKLGKLKENGILTEEEFNEKKKILLDKIN